LRKCWEAKELGKPEMASGLWKKKKNPLEGRKRPSAEYPFCPDSSAKKAPGRGRATA